MDLFGWVEAGCVSRVSEGKSRLTGAKGEKDKGFMIRGWFFCLTFTVLQTGVNMSLHGDLS